MATVSGLPKVGVKPWAALRARAAAAPSTRFTGQTAATLLGMASPDSAVGNVIAPLRRMGLLNDDGSLTERGNRWRVDATYADACQEILDELYPDDLQAFVSADGVPDKSGASTWLQHAGLGASNARQMAATWAMVAAKTPPDPVAPEAKAERPRTTAPKKAASKKFAASPIAEAPVVTSSVDRESHKQVPRVHIDIQIHIPATATADQIDQIFASMAKHLYSQ